MREEIRPLHYFERYRNKGTRTYSRHAGYTEAKGRYRPDGPNDRFDLFVYQVPLEHLVIFTANPSPDLVERYLGESWAMFCLHPQVLDTCPDDPYVRQILSASTSRTTIPVIPSSSTRTLYVQTSGTPHALKVHFPFRISRYTRKMRAEVIEQAINVSRELEREIDQLDQRFAFLREVIGVAHKNLNPDFDRGENWGHLIREMIPFPINPDRCSLVPGFALYGEDYFNPGAPLLLFDLIQDQEPVAFVLERIMLPIIRHWVACFLKLGYLLEPHGQNVLLDLDEDNSIRRIVHRDLSVGIDVRRRREIGLSNDQLNSYNLTEHGAFHSITYDKFMGGHFFDPLVAACQEKCPGVSKAAFTGPCRDEFARLFPESHEYLPKTVWYFSEERDQYNKPLYHDTEAVPEWRP